MDLDNTMDGDIVLDYLNKIRDEYCCTYNTFSPKTYFFYQYSSTVLKVEFSISRKRNQQLETEIEQLKQLYSTIDCETKRRRTDSFGKQEQQVTADDVNIPFENIDNSDDDEVINGTPQPIQKSIIKERQRHKTNRSTNPSHPEQATHSKLVTPVKISPVIRSDANTLSIPKLTEEISPLRRIENKITKGSCTKITRSEEDSPKWLTSKTPAKKSIVFFETLMEPKGIARTSKSPQRKTINLSLSKRKSLKQSTLKFLPPTVKTESSSTLTNNLLTDMDETYCNELSMPLKIGLSSTEKTRDKENNDNLFNFRSKSQIKPEPTTPDSRANRTAVSSKPSAKETRFSYDSSSVFEIPNATDDIICLEDSEPLFLMPTNEDLADQMLAKPTKCTLSPEKPIRTEYRKHNEVRSKREKAAQPGHMCPDCADWYKSIEPELSDRDIQRRLNACSRHRKEVDLPETPDGFWVPFFEPTQANETLFQYRLRNRQQLHNESQNF